MTAVTVKGNNMHMHDGTTSKKGELHFSSSYDTT